MKYKIFINSISCIFLIAVVFAFAGCTKEFDERNTPKNAIVLDNATTGLVGQAFAYAQYNSTGHYNYWYGWYATLYADMYAQYFSGIHPGFQSDVYEQSGTHMASLWTNFYSSVGSTIDFVEKYTQKNNMPVENALAKIWKVVAFHRITDHFGPIIYSQLGNGQTSVSYDSQKDIYTSFFKTLDEAVEVLNQNPGKNAFGSNDQVYAGNVDKWKVLANSLRLRLAMRIVYADPALAKAEAEKAVAAGVMTTNADNGAVLSTANSRNPISIITSIEEFRVSASLYSVLGGYHDPRMTVFMAPRWDGGGYNGLRNGVPLAQRDRTILTRTYSAIGNKWRPPFTGLWGAAGENPPMMVLSAAEVYFLRAEGALRGWNMGGTAASLYKDGIRMSISDRTDASPTEIEAYINSTDLPVGVDDLWNTPPVSDLPVQYKETADFETQLEQIITQKWIALYPDGYEAWAERRRTGYPRGYAIIESLDANLSRTQLVRRLQFSPDEYSTNSVAVNQAVTLLGGPDRIDTRLWWDAKPLADYKTPTD